MNCNYSKFTKDIEKTIQKEINVYNNKMMKLSYKKNKRPPANKQSQEDLNAFTEINQLLWSIESHKEIDKLKRLT